ncbi:UDP-glycosyltransferase UGT5-like [Bombus pascuorum]|uniref:UDP-glycosyltransferase UGT5-like n=1 Tax=Bombus pascuorum TaxID=65598 RepID=UPI00298DB5DF|nr:UDP-glycosyltransferase UGT5-like [Bombus pascuorum]
MNDWLETASHGLVYFALGSLLNIETLPLDTLLSLYAKISPIRVLMRITNAIKLLPGLPDNLRIRSWILQMSVLDLWELRKPSTMEFQ